MKKINEDEIREYLDKATIVMKAAGNKNTAPGLVNQFQKRTSELAELLSKTAKFLRKADIVKDPVRFLVITSTLEDLIDALTNIPARGLMDQTKSLILSVSDYSNAELADDCEIVETELRMRLFGPGSLEVN